MTYKLRLAMYCIGDADHFTDTCTFFALDSGDAWRIAQDWFRKYMADGGRDYAESTGRAGRKVLIVGALLMGTDNKVIAHYDHDKQRLMGEL